MSNGDLYTIITNKEGKGRGGSLFAIVYGTKSEYIIKVVEQIPEEVLT